MAKWRGRGLWWATAVLAVVWGANADLLVEPEHKVKAGFLYNFAQFVEWPTNTQFAADSSFAIGVWSNESLAAALETVVVDKEIRQREVKVVRVNRLEQARSCQILFIGRSQRTRLPEILARLDHAPTLTVGEMEGFCQRGGMINFYEENKRVRFEINPRAANRVGLKISSRLLRLSRIIRPPPANARP